MAQIVTITNPLTGQPAQVDQLEHTAQEIDDGISRALPGGAIDIALQNKANATVAEQHDFPLISPFTSPNSLKYSKNELGLVVIQGNLYKANGLSAGYTQIGTMPSGFRPSFQSHSPVFINVGYATPTVGELYIKNDNGYAAIYVPKALTGEVNISINACYVAGDS